MVMKIERVSKDVNEIRTGGSSIYLSEDKLARLARDIPAILKEEFMNSDFKTDKNEKKYKKI